MIRQHLLPLTNYLVNGSYDQVLPIASKFAERCIYCLLTRNWVVGLGEFFFETTETTETTETKETTAKQSIIRMIINFSVISVVPTVSVVSFLKKGAAF